MKSKIETLKNEKQKQLKITKRINGKMEILNLKKEMLEMEKQVEIAEIKEKILKNNIEKRKK